MLTQETHSSIFTSIHCQSCISAAKDLHNQNKGLCKQKQGHNFCPEAFTDSKTFKKEKCHEIDVKIGSFTAVS